MPITNPIVNSGGGGGIASFTALDQALQQQAAVAMQHHQLQQAQLLMEMARSQQQAINQTFALPTLTSNSTGGEWFFTSTTNATTLPTHYVNFVSQIEIDEADYMNNREYYELARQRGVQFRVRTAEQTRLRSEEIARINAAYEEQERKHHEAKTKARELLLEHLTPAQRDTFEKNRWFIVHGGKTKTRYRIKTDYGVAGNIDVLDTKNKKVASLCCHCKDYAIPYEDQFLGQALALKYDEENFLKLAVRRAA